MQKKTLCILHIFCLLSLYSTSTFSMLKRAHKKNVQRSVQELRHQQNLQQITTIQNTQKIDTIIEKIKKDIYEECIQEIESNTNIPYDFISYIIDETRKNIQESLQQNNCDAFHDPHMPKELYEKVIQNLNENNINPNNIVLKYKKSEQPNLIAKARGQVFDQDKSQITLYKNITALSPDRQDFTIQHEVAHLYLGHTAISAISRSKKIISIKEREADIYASSKNSASACAGAISRCDYSHIDIIDHQDHCRTMQIMCALMKHKEELSLN